MDRTIYQAIRVDGRRLEVLKMTINELMKLCTEEIANNRGDSEVIVCCYDETYQSLERGFSSPVYNALGCTEYIEDNGLDVENTLILNQGGKRSCMTTNET